MNQPNSRKRCAVAISESPIGQAWVEESVLGWKEYELEVMRDQADNFVVVCSIENLDPMGIHTGDSITVAPAQTLTDREYQILRDLAREVMSAVGVETGGSNVQFAVDPRTGRVLVIEMNPRVSRSSSLASKATGCPDCQVGRLGRGRVYAGRNRQRHHRSDQGCLRTFARLCGCQNPALGVREIPGCGPGTRSANEIGGRSDGPGADIPRSA